MDLTQLLQTMKDQGASDMHLHAMCPPILRIEGKLLRTGDPPLSIEEVDTIAQSIMNNIQKKDQKAVDKSTEQQAHLLEGKEKIIAMHKEEDEFRRGMGKEMAGWLVSMGIEVPPFEPSIILTEGELMLGKEKFQVIHTPGHSPGGICLYWEKEKILVTGDTIFYGSIGRTDFPGGSLSQLGKGVEKLEKLDVEVVLPGHSTEYGSLIDGKAKVERNFQSIKSFFY